MLQTAVEILGFYHPAVWWISRRIRIERENCCDDTAAAVVQDGDTILSSMVSSQIDVHHPYGGVVPELASRDHVRKALPLLSGVLSDSGVDRHAIAGVAYTAGPGLVGALLVGVRFGAAFAWGFALPIPFGPG